MLNLSREKKNSHIATKFYAGRILLRITKEIKIVCIIHHKYINLNIYITMDKNPFIQQ